MEKILTFDSNEMLELRHYSDETTKQSPQEIKNCRGNIYDKNENLVIKSFNYTPEYVDELPLELTDMQDWVFFRSVEGTLLRLFNFNDVWYLSSHKKLNAYNSRWSCTRTFGELFEDSLKNVSSSYEEIVKTLDKNNGYLFLVTTNQENRIVCNPPEKQGVYFIGELKDRTKFSFSNLEFFPSPVPLELKTPDELLTEVRNIDTKTYQGIIAFSKTNNIQFKILNKTYEELRKLRGNEPNLVKQYLKLRNVPENVKKFITLYSDFDYKTVENDILRLSLSLYNLYINRFVYKAFTPIPAEQFVLIKKCHDQYKKTLKKITPSDIINIINSHSVGSLAYILKNFLQLPQNK